MAQPVPRPPNVRSRDPSELYRTSPKSLLTPLETVYDWRILPSGSTAILCLVWLTGPLTEVETRPEVPNPGSGVPSWAWAIDTKKRSNGRIMFLMRGSFWSSKIRWYTASHKISGNEDNKIRKKTTINSTILVYITW